MKNNFKLPLAAIPAVLVSLASLLVLLASVAGAASESKPVDLAYSLRGPALQAQFILNTYDAPQTIPVKTTASPLVVTPKDQSVNANANASAGASALPSKQDLDVKTTQSQISNEKSDGQTIIDTQSFKAENTHENETESHSEGGGGSESGKSGSGGKDDSGSNKGKK